MSAPLKVRKSIPRTYPHLFWSKKLVIAIVIFLAVQTVMAIVTLLAIETDIHLSGIEPGIKCKEHIVR